ncbi:autotransporter outer membrane beta-barrel domain-containing protein, partial [Comamonas testosteroni]
LGGLTKVGSGTLTLTGNSNLADNTLVNAGTLKVDGTLGSNLLTVASGATLTGSGNANATVVIGNGGQLAGQSGSTLGLGSLVLNSGSIVNAGLGAPSTGGTALFSVGGNLTLDGTLNVSNIGGFGNGVYRIFNYSGGLTDNGLDFGSLPLGVALGDVSLQTALANQVNLLVSSAGLGLQFWNGSQTVPTGQIEGGAGVWNASNSNWSDANGMLSATWGNNFAVFQGTGGDVTVEGSHTVNGMQFVSNGYRLLAGTGGELNLVNDTGGNTNLRVDPGATAILDVGLTGSGKLNKLDTGTLVLNGSNTYTGGTVLSGGTLVAGNNNALGSGMLETAAGVTLDSNTAVKLSNAISLGGPLNIAGSNNLELAGVINGAGGLVKNGSAALTLSGSNGYNGTTTINAGTLQVGNGGTSGNLGTGAVTNNGSLVFNRSDATTVSNNISGTGSLVHVGTGITTLTGSNSYTGGTFVQAGTLKIGTLSSLVQGTLYQVSSGATLDLNGYALKTGGISGTGHVALGSQGLTVNTAAGAVSEFDGKMDGTGELIKQGDGTLSLNTANSFSGGVSHKGGNINLGNEKGLGSGTLSMDDDTKITLIANGMTIANNLHMTGNNDPIVDTGSNNGTWTGAITGAGFLTKQGTGTLTMTSTGNTYTGATDVAQGTLQAGAANTFSSTSAHTVASGAVLDLAGYNQTLASLNNSGTVKLSSNSGAAPGTVLKVTGAYVGNNGNLGLSTVLGADGSATDKLLLSGASAVASGSTTVHITNAGGLGAQTTGNGIGIIGTENGASLQPGSFTLAGGHVDAGAYEYRLTQNTQGAALHSTTTAPTTPTTPTTAYRAEVPLLSALPAQLRQADMAMLGDLRKRMGDEGAQATTSSDTGASRRVWGRILRTDPKISQQGTVSPESSGHLTGFQAGLDLYADQSIKAGIYVGQLEGDMSVKGFASGVDRKYVGFNNLRTRYLGVYGTWQDQSGLYADAVLQGADYRSDLRTAGDTAQARTKGSGWLASLEMGKAFAVTSNWQIEPQAQIIYRKLSIDDTALSLATVKNKADDDWTVRLGARIKGNFATGAGVLQPYGRINVYKASNTTDIASFAAPGGTTDIKAKGGYTATEMAAGASLQINPRTSVYGELGKLWANGGDSRVKSGVQASIGVKVQW